MSRHKYYPYLLFLACGIGTMSGQVARYNFDTIYETSRGAWVPNMARAEADKAETDALDLLMFDTNDGHKNLVKAKGVGGKGFALDLSCNLPGVENAAKARRTLATKEKTREQNCLTLTGWIKSSAPIKPETVLFGGYQGSMNSNLSSGFWLTADDASNLHVSILGGDMAVRSEINDERISRQGEWIFYAVSWSGETGVFQWYLGGESTKAAPIAAQEIPESIGVKIAFRTLHIGASVANHAAYCGVLDDIRLYAETLTPEQIEEVRRSQLQGK
ncbi:LamG domain-containing protein [Termitidicoccus mucosus]|uniref:LamG-like jellyroll fold domain-containing protein n=1 Tax=Termitidicoccus mucosus TaxID=1184151 RepID=A0A178IPI9_9BACT|nr:hypothetical protein AW736_01875 [Opitutaceae bacterium TSB47]